MLKLSSLYPRRLAGLESELREFWSVAVGDARRERGTVGALRMTVHLVADVGQTWLEEWGSREGQPFSRGDSWMATWSSDLRYSARSLWRRPGLTIAAVLSLAVGLGGSLAIYAAAHAVLLRPLPFETADRLVQIQTMVQRDALEPRSTSVPDFLDFRAQATQTLEQVAAWSDDTYTLRTDRATDRVTGELASGRYFAALGERPLAGAFYGDRDVPEAEPPVVLRASLRDALFGEQEEAIGRRVFINDRPHVVVGISRAEFRGISDSADFWIPFAMHDALVSRDTWTSRGSRWHAAIGLLRPGISADAAQAELQAVAARLASSYATSNAAYTVRVRSMTDAYFNTVRPQLIVLLAAVGVVLLMTCVNVANLLVARLSARQYEFTVRAALGASWRRVLSLSAADGVVLALLGSLAGAPLAYWLVAILRQLNPVALPSFASPAITGAVAGVGLVMTLVAAAFIAAVSMLSLSRQAGAVSLSSRGASDTARSVRLRLALTVVQIACAVALLTTATLLGLSFRNLTRVEPGYRTSNLLAARVEFPAATYSTGRLQSAKLDLMRRLKTLPGARAVALSSDTMLDGQSSAISFTADIPAETPADAQGRVYRHSVTASFFDVAGIPIKDGSTLPEFDGGLLDNATVEMPIVVSEDLARRFWPTESAVGHRLKFGRSDADRPWMRIVGVAGVTKFRDLPDNPTADPDVYLPYAAHAGSTVAMLIHSSVDPLSLRPSVQRVLADMDRTMPLFDVYAMDAQAADATAPQRFLAELSSAFGVVALLLAVIGTYGVVAYQVQLSRRAIGIRMALGATPQRIFAGILASMGRMLAAGLAGGLLLIWYLSAGLRDQLFQVSPLHVPVLVSVALVVCVVALLSAFGPARRAMSVEPASVLRSDA